MSNFVKRHINIHEMTAALGAILKALLLSFSQESFIVATVIAYVYYHITTMINVSDANEWAKLISTIVLFFMAFTVAGMKFTREYSSFMDWWRKRRKKIF